MMMRVAFALYATPFDYRVAAMSPHTVARLGRRRFVLAILMISKQHSNRTCHHARRHEDDAAISHYTSKVAE